MNLRFLVATGIGLNLCMLAQPIAASSTDSWFAFESSESESARSIRGCDPTTIECVSWDDSVEHRSVLLPQESQQENVFATALPAPDWEWTSVVGDVRSACKSCRNWSLFDRDSAGCKDQCSRQENRGVVGNALNKPGHCWIARFDSLVLWRNAPQNLPLFETSQGRPTLNANQLSSDVLAAPRISLFRANDCGYGIETTYIYAGNFYGERFLPPGTSLLATPIFNNPIRPTGYTQGTTQLLGRFQSLEVNGRTPVGSGYGNIQFLSGFRWIQWHENLSIIASGADAAGGLTYTDSFTTSCFNDLYGGQIGFDALLYQSRRAIRVEGLVKAGAYYNTATQASAYTLVQTPGTDVSRSNYVSGIPAGAAFMGEVGLTGVLPLRSNLDVRIGYSGFWLESLAQPTNQLTGQTLTQSAPTTSSLSMRGAVVLQGISLGLEGRW